MPMLSMRCVRRRCASIFFLPVTSVAATTRAALPSKRNSWELTSTSMMAPSFLRCRHVPDLSNGLRRLIRPVGEGEAGSDSGPSVNPCARHGPHADYPPANKSRGPGTSRSRLLHPKAVRRQEFATRSGMRRERYSHPPLRFSTGRIRMKASTAWIWPS
jgi:hypothetical protein